MTTIRQSEFQEIHKLQAAEIAGLRRDLLTEGMHWFANGRTIHWSMAAAEIVASALADRKKPGQVAAMEVMQTIPVRIVKAARNPKFVYGDLNGERIAVACGKHASRIIGKKVEVRTETVDGVAKYTYQP